MPSLICWWGFLKRTTSFHAGNDTHRIELELIDGASAWPSCPSRPCNRLVRSSPAFLGRRVAARSVATSLQGGASETV
jgi:hypothetical protein